MPTANLKSASIYNPKLKSKPTSINIEKTSKKISSKTKSLKPSNKPKKGTVKFSPQPYRIIIRLSGANPSAPAETVTRALRDAGIIFEVEKIERFSNDSSFNWKTKEVKEP